MFSLFATPLGWLMKGCYKLIGNYGLALLLFTLITRLLMLPLSIKQQKSTARMSMIQPELEKLKKKYGKNQEKLNEETMALYQKHGVNPMASCLPMLISMLILFSMIPVIYGPMTYVSDVDKDTITKANNTISMVAAVSQDIKNNDTTMAKLLAEKGSYDEVKKVIVNEDDKNYKNTYKLFGYDKDDDEEDKKERENLWKDLVAIFEKHPDIDVFITNPEYISQNLVVSRPELATFDFVDETKANAQYQDILPDAVVDYAKSFKYEFFGLSLGAIPTFNSWLAVIPFASFVLQLIATLLSTYYNKKNNPAQHMGMGMKIMFLALPLFSLWIAFEYPAGLGLYWIYSSLFAVVQTVFLNILYSPAKIRAQVEAEMEKNKERRKNGKKSFMERAIEMQQEQRGEKPKRYSDDDDDDDDDGSDDKDGSKKLSKQELKEQQRRKLNEARKRMAEKYGDEYTEE